MIRVSPLVIFSEGRVGGRIGALMSERGYLRQPCLWRDSVVFVCDDDLWRVDATGGPARRLTAGLGEVGWPALSPDGRYLAIGGFWRPDDAAPTQGEVRLLDVASGKTTPRKDLAMMAISYGNVYVAQIAMGANNEQALVATASTVVTSRDARPIKGRR